MIEFFNGHVFMYISGDIAFRYLDGVLSKLPQEEIEEEKISNDIVICDINKSMLEVGRKRAHRLGIDKGKHFIISDFLLLYFMVIYNCNSSIF